MSGAHLDDDWAARVQPHLFALEEQAAELRRLKAVMARTYSRALHFGQLSPDLAAIRMGKLLAAINTLDHVCAGRAHLLYEGKRRCRAGAA